MNTIQNLERFRFSIRQPPSCDWCIPASIEVVTKYHRPTSGKDQYDIAMMFHTKGLELGLAHVKAAIQGDFDWANICYDNTLRKFDDLTKKIEKCVSNSTPPIISIPVGSKEDHLWHMLVPVGYDDLFFRVYNPHPNIIGDYCDVKKSLIENELLKRKSPEDTATDILTISELSKSL